MTPFLIDWVKVPLDNLGKWQGGSTPSKRNSSYWTGGSIPWVSPKDFNNENITSSPDCITESALSDGRSPLIPSGSILIVTRSGILRRTLPIAVNQIPVAINQDVKAFIPVPGIEPEFIRYQLRAFIPELLAAAVKSGTTVESIDFQSLRNFQILVVPTDTQRKIVQQLNRTTKKISDARVAIAKAAEVMRNVRQAILKSALSGQLTSDWRVASGEQEPWKCVSVQDVAAEIRYGSSAKSARRGKVAVLRMGNIQDGQLDLKDLAYTSSAREIERYLLKDGDVLFNRTNSPQLVGKTATYRSEIPAIAAGYLIVVRCNNRIIPELLTYILNGPLGKEYWWAVKSDGVSQSNINAQKLAAFKFDLPPIAEQVEVVRKLNAISLSVRAAFQYLNVLDLKLDGLEKRILRMAFLPDIKGAEPGSSVHSLMREAEQFRSELSHMIPRTGRAMKKRTSTIDLLRAQILTWPENGVTFPDLWKTIPGDYESIKEALFHLMSGPTPEVRQHFDKTARLMRLTRSGS